jgi:hypothetical protein
LVAFFGDAVLDAEESDAGDEEEPADDVAGG